MNKSCPEQWFHLAMVLAVISGIVIVLWKYIDRNVKMSQEIPVKKDKGSSHTMAAGYLGAFFFLFTSYAEKALDFTYYGIHIDLLAPAKVITIAFGLYHAVKSGGKILTNIKPSQLFNSEKDAAE